MSVINNRNPLKHDLIAPIAESRRIQQEVNAPKAPSLLFGLTDTAIVLKVVGYTGFFCVLESNTGKQIPLLLEELQKIPCSENVSNLGDTYMDHLSNGRIAIIAKWKQNGTEVKLVPYELILLEEIANGSK